MPETSEMEERGRLQLEAVTTLLDDASIIVHEVDGMITRWTRGCEHLYGWSKEETTGKIVHQLLSTLFPLPLSELRRQVSNHGAWSGEVVRHHKDGHRLLIATRWVFVNFGGDRSPVM